MRFLLRYEIASLSNLKTRSLMQPLLTKRYIIIADISGNIYKYNQNNLNIKPEIFSIGTGIISNKLEGFPSFYFPICLITVVVISLFMVKKEIPRWAGCVFISLYVIFVVGALTI